MFNIDQKTLPYDLKLTAWDLIPLPTVVLSVFAALCAAIGTALYRSRREKEGENK